MNDSYITSADSHLNDNQGTIEESARRFAIEANRRMDESQGVGNSVGEEVNGGLDLEIGGNETGEAYGYMEGNGGFDWESGGNETGQGYGYMYGNLGGFINKWENYNQEVGGNELPPPKARKPKKNAGKRELCLLFSGCGVFLFLAACYWIWASQGNTVLTFSDRKIANIAWKKCSFHNVFYDTI